MRENPFVKKVSIEEFRGEVIRKFSKRIQRSFEKLQNVTALVLMEKHK